MLRRGHLRYVHDGDPGIRRRRVGPTFRYCLANGKPVTDEATIDRIRKLAIPPAYEGVWICRSPAGHIQATGLDSRGRKQYRYHPEWRRLRDEHKFSRVATFANRLSEIRRRVAADLRLNGISRDRVLAAMVRLLDRTAMRAGNETYARENASYGLASLRKRHVKLRGSAVCLTFTAKGQKQWNIQIEDDAVAGLIRSLRRLPGRRLFRYRDDRGGSRPLLASDLNDYLKRAAGRDVSAKDFRTWNATLIAAETMLARECDRRRPMTKRLLRECIDVVAVRLGHTAAVCRKSYLPPALIEAFTEARLASLLARAEPRSRHPHLALFERKVLRFLATSCIAADTAPRSGTPSNTARCRS